MEKRISEQQVQKMKDAFMGKKITFETVSGDVWVGKCQFIGYNQHLPSWGFQVTIDRLPCPHVKPETIELVEEKKPMFK
jgi:hypothetical protein